MTKRAIKLHPTDNIAVCTSAVIPGDTVLAVDPSNHSETLVSVSNIAYTNKIALTDLAVDTPILKYGEVIGKATKPIAKGELVNHENIVGIARNYADEYRLGGAK